MCIKLKQICDGKQNCPHGDDENPKVCYPNHHPGGDHDPDSDNTNFAGTGFQFKVGNLIVRRNSKAKMFNQESDNTKQ